MTFSSLGRGSRIAGASRLAALLAGSLAAWLLASDGVSAASGYSFAMTPGKLPKTVVPTHYAVDLQPDLDQLLVSGTVTADIDVSEATDKITLNAVNIGDASADADAVHAGSIAFDAPAQTMTLDFAQALAPGHHQLVIRFTSHINKFGRGVYLVDYPTQAGRKRMLATQLEPADARRIFPCWDEPAFKATFDLTVTVPQDFLAVSNMPVEREVPGEGGRKRVTFATTPKMSTYLFVLVAGELERLAGEADGISVGVVTTRGKSAAGRYALDSAISLLKYYDDYFGVKYPLPKLDLIAVPGGFGGAMENWGGITFFESRLLYDPQTTSPTARRGIFVVLAHEMAHQWFGDLVTTAWWNDIWLNEGFASWMQEKAADRFNPDWHVWLNASQSKQAVMTTDAQRTSHPIEQKVADESEAMTAFDGITYIKGQALIRMIESYLGEDVFRAGIRAYMQAHAYSNATTADLWQALAAASGKPVAAVAGTFTEQPGVPLIAADESCSGGRRRLALRQERFTIHNPDAKAEHWQVPIAYGPLGGTAPADVVPLDGSADIDAGSCGEPIKLNLGDVGYYRVQYDAATRSALVKSLNRMTVADRVNFLDDAWALVESGRAAPPSFLDLIDVLDPSDDRVVWDGVISVFAKLDHLEQGKPGRSSLQAYARAKLHPVFDRLGWDAAPGEPDEREQLRSRLIRVLGDFGDQAILGEAKRRFAAFVHDPASLRTGLREPVTHLVGRTADRATYDRLHALARATTSTDERSRYYAALAAALDPALAKQTLAIALTEEVPTTLVNTLIFGVAAEHRDLAWAFVRENFDALAARQGPSFRDSMAAGLLGTFSDRVHAAELAQFAPAHATAGGRITAARSEENILTDTDLGARLLPAVDDHAGHFLSHR